MNTKRLKSFEHGDTFVLLESIDGVYKVSLFLNGRASTGMDVIPDNSFETTTLDAACEVYHQTCKHCVELSGQ
jgi:hypothetical protein